MDNADGVIILGGGVHIVRGKAEIFIMTIKESGFEVNADKLLRGLLLRSECRTK